MDKKEIIFRIKEEWNTAIIILKYFIKEPYYELKKLINGYYNSMLVFWLTLSLFIYMWYLGRFGRYFKAMGVLVLLTYLYMFVKNKRWKEYYQKEMIEGKNEL